MQVNSNSGSQILELLKARRQSIQTMVKDVQGGDISGAQQALTQLQQTDQSLGISEGSSDDSSSGTSSRPGRPHMDLSNLVSAVQSGDLSAAQDAWQQVQANMSNSPYGGGGSGGNLRGMAKDLTSLLDAVNSGDQDSMQTAASAVAQDLQSFTGQTSDATQQTASATDTSISTDPRQTLIGDLQNLITAAQSGDASSAQSAEQKLQQDLQSAMSGVHHGGHHHHHHHHSGGAPATTATDTTLPTPDTTMANTTSTDPSATDPDVTSIIANEN